MPLRKKKIAAHGDIHQTSAPVHLPVTHRRESRKSIKHEFKNQENVVVARSPLDVWPQICLFVILVVLMVIGSHAFPWSVQQVVLGSVFEYEISIGFPFFAIFPLVLLATIIHDLLNSKYIVAKDYVLHVYGLMQFDIKTVRIPYRHLRVLEVDRSFHQRFFNIGDLRTGHRSGDPRSEIVMRGIYNPAYYKDVIHARMAPPKS